MINFFLKKKIFRNEEKKVASLERLLRRHSALHKRSYPKRRRLLLPPLDKEAKTDNHILAVHFVFSTAAWGYQTRYLLIQQRPELASPMGFSLPETNLIAGMLHCLGCTVEHVLYRFLLSAETT